MAINKFEDDKSTNGYEDIVVEGDAEALAADPVMNFVKNISDKIDELVTFENDAKELKCTGADDISLSFNTRTLVLTITVVVGRNTYTTTLTLS
jgi:hypothetical protein